jgi:hypothetical protein
MTSNSLSAVAALLLASLLPSVPAGAGVFLIQDFESLSSPTDNFPTFYKEPTAPDSLTVTTERARSGKHSLKVNFLASEWKKEEPKRVEIFSLAWGQTGMALRQDWWVGFSEYIPADWEIDHPNNPDLIWQFHGWEGGPASNNPPLSAVVFGDKLYIRLAEGTVPAERATSFKDLAILPLPKGEWMDVVLDLNFDYKAGHVNMWLNGKQIVTYSGPTLYPMIGQKNENGPGLKLGVYKFDWGNVPTQAKRRTLYLDEIRFGDSKSSYDEVRPR